jgi:uncharacterized protein YggL (DUF469 family)
MSAACPTFAFLVEIEIEPEAAASADDLWEAFIAFAGERGLLADGGRGYRRWTYRLHGEGMQATDADRAAFRSWASTRPEIVSTVVGELFDLGSA